MTTGGLIAGFTVALLAGLVARTTELKEDASLATFYLVSLALGVTIVSDQGHQYRSAARAVRQHPGDGRPDAARHRLQCHRHAIGAGGDLPAAGDRMRRSGVPAHRQPRRRARASGVSRAGRHQPRQRLSRARHAARRRADDPARRHRALLVARHHRHDLHRGRERHGVGLCRAGAVVPDQDSVGACDHPGRGGALPRFRCCSAAVSGLVRQMFPGRHLEA